MKREPACGGGAFTLQELLVPFFRDWRRIAVGFFVPMLAAVAAALLATPQYEAVATLLVRMGREYLYRPQLAEEGPGVSFEREQTLKSEVEILVSHDLLAKTIEEVGPARLFPGLHGEAAVAALRQGLDALLLKDSNVIRVTFHHPDAAIAAETVNRLVEAYLARRHELFLDRRVPALAAQVDQYQRHLREQASRMETFKRTNGIVAFGEQRALLLRQRSELDTRLKVAQNGLAEVRQRLEAQRHNVDTAMRGGRVAVMDAIEGEVLKLEADERSAEAGHAVLVEQLAQLDAHIAQLSRKERQLDETERETALAADTYRSFARKLEDARMLEVMDREQSANVRIIQTARPPAQPASRRLLILAVGFAASVITAMLVAFVSDWLQDTFASPQKLERSLGIPVLASFPLEGRPAPSREPRI